MIIVFVKKKKKLCKGNSFVILIASSGLKNKTRKKQKNRCIL